MWSLRNAALKKSNPAASSETGADEEELKAGAHVGFRKPGSKATQSSLLHLLPAPWGCGPAGRRAGPQGGDGTPAGAQAGPAPAGGAPDSAAPPSALPLLWVKGIFSLICQPSHTLNSNF